MFGQRRRNTNLFSIHAPKFLYPSRNRTYPETGQQEFNHFFPPIDNNLYFYGGKELPHRVSHPRQSFYPYGMSSFQSMPGYLPYFGIHGGFNYLGQNGNLPFSQGLGKGQISAESIFQNPLQPVDNSFGNGVAGPYSGNPSPYKHPYPKQSFVPRPPSGMQSVLNSFKTQDGSFDVNKMINTAGQMMNAVTQVSSMVKGLGGILKV